MRVGGPAPESFDGRSTDRSALEFAMFIGDITWLTRTDPRLAFAVHNSAKFFHNPGPQHFVSARCVLAHLRKDTKGLTFHGSGAVLNQSQPHRHACIGMMGSGFFHKEAKAVSGCSSFMNGAAIYHVARRQIAVPGTSAEAEVKAQKKRRAMMKKKKRKEQKDPENIQFTYQKKKEKKTYHMYN
jgi:hypothetical protein